MIELPECHYRISVKGLLLDETREKFLVVQEDNGKWELPGGGLDHGETPQECLRREIREEMGLEVSSVAQNPAYFLTFVKKSWDGRWIANVLYEFTVKNLDFKPSEECVALKFVSADEALTLDAFPNVHELAKLFGKA